MAIKIGERDQILLSRFGVHVKNALTYQKEIDLHLCCIKCKLKASNAANFEETVRVRKIQKTLPNPTFGQSCLVTPEMVLLIRMTTSLWDSVSM
jgi:hypothetical protein